MAIHLASPRSIKKPLCLTRAQRDNENFWFASAFFFVQLHCFHARTANILSEFDYGARLSQWISKMFSMIKWGSDEIQNRLFNSQLGHFHLCLMPVNFSHQLFTIKHMLDWLLRSRARKKIYENSMTFSLCCAECTSKTDDIFSLR